MPTSTAPEPLPPAAAAQAGWWRDTLAKRLFAWLWLSLVVSHVVAIVTTHAVFGSPHRLRLASMPVLPALPPTPGLHDAPQRLGAQVADRLGTQPPVATAALAPASAAAGAGPPPLPTPHLLLDYVLRALLLAGFAWAGARWLARPMAQLSQAAGHLAAAPGSATPPHLAETGMAEVRHTARAFNHMARQLSQHVRERELTMAAISHDLRTPLTRMRLRLERLQGQPGAQACIADVHEMDALIGQVLALLRDATAAEPATALDLRALLQALVDDRSEAGAAAWLHAAAASEGHGHGGTAAIVQAPPLCLRRLLDNLLDNAIRHGGSADLSLVRDDGTGRWCIHVDDRGPGISAGQLQAALQPWCQLGSGGAGLGGAGDARGGSGLGLYIADQLARRLGADLRLRNRPEGGLRASLRLPG